MKWDKNTEIWNQFWVFNVAPVCCRSLSRAVQVDWDQSFLSYEILCHSVTRLLLPPKRFHAVTQLFFSIPCTERPSQNQVDLCTSPSKRVMLFEEEKILSSNVAEESGMNNAMRIQTHFSTKQLLHFGFIFRNECWLQNAYGSTKHIIFIMLRESSSVQCWSEVSYLQFSCRWNNVRQTPNSSARLHTALHWPKFTQTSTM